METITDGVEDQLAQLSDDPDPVPMDHRPLGENPQGEDVGSPAYTADRAPGLGMSAPPNGAPADKPKGLRGLFAKREKPAQQAAPATKEKRPSSKKIGRRVSAADTIGDIQAGIGGLLVRSGQHRPMGMWLQFSSGVNGELVDDAVKGTFIDRAILQPVAKGRGRFDALGAVFGPPAIIYAIERDPARADVLIPLLKSSIRNALPLMAPAIKRLQKKEQEIAAAAAEMGFDGEGDPADAIIQMIFEGWEPPAPTAAAEPQPEPEDESAYATQAP